MLLKFLVWFNILQLAFIYITDSILIRILKFAASMFAPVPVENVISAVCRDSLHDQSSTSPCGSSVSAAESQEPPPENNCCASPQTIQTCDDIRLVESNSPPFNTQEEQQLQNPHSLPSFSVSQSSRKLILG